MESDNKKNNCDKDVPATLEVATPGQQPDSNNATHMGFQQTVMYGEYSKALGELAKKEAREDIELSWIQHYNFCNSFNLGKCRNSLQSDFGRSLCLLSQPNGLTATG